MVKPGLFRRYLTTILGLAAAAFLLTFPLGCRAPSKTSADSGIRPIPSRSRRRDRVHRRGGPNPGYPQSGQGIPVVLQGRRPYQPGPGGDRLAGQGRDHPGRPGRDRPGEPDQARPRAALAVAEASYANLKAGSRPETIAISRAQLQQAEANLAAQKSNYERMKSLYDDKLVSQQQYEAAYCRLPGGPGPGQGGPGKSDPGRDRPQRRDICVTAEAQVQQARRGQGDRREPAAQPLHNRLRSAVMSPWPRPTWARWPRPACP